MFNKKIIIKVTSVIAILLIIISLCSCSGIEENILTNEKEIITIDKDNFEDFFNVNISVDYCNFEKLYDLLGVQRYKGDGQITITITPREELEVENLVVKLSVLQYSAYWETYDDDENGYIGMTLPSNGNLTKTIHCHTILSSFIPEYLNGTYSVALGTRGTIKK